MDSYNAQAPAVAQDSVRRTDSLFNGSHPGSNTIFNSVLEDPTYIFPFSSTDPRREQPFDTRGYVFPELFSTEAEPQNFMSTTKVSLEIHP